ncbi:MAG: damage-inducible protein CinA [Planctomycetaceae bacterium]|jgi:nicotinamide-nucleotide amidase|nr:damage-inducible protein CinA [Planctomycetaceae bacterium]
MKAEIISNGDEITSGKVLDTNSQWLSRELMELGIRVLYHTTVGDDGEAMVNVLRTATGRVDLIIWTGGLGPTADDLTRQVISEFAREPLVLHEESLERIKSMFKRRGFTMAESNKIQAYQPQNAVPILNPQGTAPGIDLIVKIGEGEVEPTALQFDQALRIDFKNCVRIMAFPGVPAELRAMWSSQVKDSLREMLQKKSGKKHVIKSRVINCFGEGESQIEAMLPDIINRNHIPRVGITASQGTISLRITAEAEDDAGCDKLILPVVKLIYEKLSDLIFSEGDERLQDVVCRELNRLGKTVSVIESGTRGKLAELMANVAESKKCFCGGVVLPFDRKRSIDVEMEMSKRLFDADYILSIGTYPDPSIIETINKNTSTNTTTLTIINNSKNNSPNIITQENYPFGGYTDITDDLHVKRMLNMFRKWLKTIGK